MGLMKYLKGTAALLTIAALAFALSGCGGGEKKKTKNFDVPADQLPAGVVSVITPRPNNETLFVRALVQEAARRNYVAKKYNEALIHYDSKKGNAAEHKKLLQKAKMAWKSARDAASVAAFYAIGLSQMERTKGYDPYQKTAMLTVPEIHLMPVAYAKEDKKLNTKEEVFSKYSKMTIVKDILKVPEGKRLLAISKMYHTSGETAIEIMRTVNPNYRAAEQGSSMAADAADVAYKAANIAKTAGKAAGVVVAGAAAVAAAPAAVPAAVAVVAVKTADTVVDAHQTYTVLTKDEEDKDLDQLLKYTETADTAVSIVTFDLTKPVMKMKGVGQYKFVEGATTADKIKGYGYMTGKGFQSGFGELAKLELGNAARLINVEGSYNALGVVTGVYSRMTDSPQDNKEKPKVYDPNAAWALSACEREDGRIETRTSVFDLINKQYDTEENRKKAQALGKKIGDIIESAKEEKEKKAKSATASHKELEKEAEEAANAGGAGNYQKVFDVFLDSARKEMIENFLDGGSKQDLDKLISEMAGEEMKATGVMISTDAQGNIVKASIVGEKKDAPFAPSKVAGSYKVYVPKEKTTAYVTVRPNGGTISVSYYYYWEITNSKGEVTKRQKESEGPFTPSYDPQTGRGTAGKYSFWFTNNGGQMSLSVR